LLGTLEETPLPGEVGEAHDVKGRSHRFEREGLRGA
jgi:hypothetical protein